jgi:hypothetical protein
VNPAALIVPIVIPFLFVGVGFLLASFSGWQKLAKVYPLIDEFTGKWHYFENITVGGLWYQWMISVKGGQAGMQLSACFPFWPGHSAIFVPWRDIEVDYKGHGVLTRTLWFKFNKCPDVVIRVNAILGSQLEKDAGDSWPTTKLPGWYSPPAEPY